MTARDAGKMSRGDVIIASTHFHFIRKGLETLPKKMVFCLRVCMVSVADSDQ